MAGLYGCVMLKTATKFGNFGIFLVSNVGVLKVSEAALSFVIGELVLFF